MGNQLPSLHGELKIFGRRFTPPFSQPWLGELVKGVLYFDKLEGLKIFLLGDGKPATTNLDWNALCHCKKLNNWGRE